MARKILKAKPLLTVPLLIIVLLTIQFYFPINALSHFPLKLASLAPSATELVYSIGAQSQLVGVSSFCDFPADAKSKTVVGSFTTCNLERLKRIQPDKILLVSGQEALAKQLERNHFETVIFPNHKLSDIPANLLTLATITGQKEAAKERSETFKNALAELRAINAGKRKTTTFFCVYPQPLITVGANSYLHDVIKTCGGDNIASSMPQDYPHFSLEKLLLCDPDVIVMPYEARNQLFLQRAPWTKLSAVKKKRCFFLPAPSQDSLSRPTVRTLEGLFWLSSKLHPELYQALQNWKKRWIR